MLCEKCSNLHFRPFEDSSLQNHLFDERDRVFVILHNDKDALESSAKQGCSLCGMILEMLFKLGRHRSDDYITKYFANKEVLLTQKRPNRRQHPENWDITVYCEGKFTICSNLSVVALPGTANKLSLSSSRNPNSNHTVPGVVPRRDLMFEHFNIVKQGDLRLPPQMTDLDSPQLDTSTTSPANLELARVWLKSCLETHLPCQDSQMHGILPTQILDITDPQLPILVSGDERREPYATLSYKWGSTRRYVTTTQNLAEHNKGIPLLGLPATFRDGITVANSLEFRYLWIDALCIVQDMEAEKEREIGRMTEIFSRSTLTIFAAMGNDADAGLSVERDPRSTKPSILNVRTTADGRTTEETVCVLVDDHKLWELTGEPLWGRGWVLQEQILSTRGLIFGSTQISWQCLCQSSMETRPWYNYRRIDTFEDDRFNYRSYGGPHVYNGYPSTHVGLDQLNHIRRLFHLPRHNVRAAQRSEVSQANKWNTMVSDYSRRSLTYGTDVLLALSGLASAASLGYECAYRAGLWEDYLSNGLLWYIAEPQTRMVKERLPGLPSWSWTSQWGHNIDFLNWGEEGAWHDKYEVKVASRTQYDKHHTSNPFGAVGEKTLTLTGRMRPANYNPQTKAVSDPISHMYIGSMSLDPLPDNELPTVIYCLLCRVKSADWELAALGLVPTDRINEFRRVGLVRLRNGNNYFGHIYTMCDRVCGNPRHNHDEDTMYLRTINVV